MASRGSMPECTILMNARREAEGDGIVCYNAEIGCDFHGTICGLVRQTDDSEDEKWRLESRLAAMWQHAHTSPAQFNVVNTRARESMCALRGAAWI